MDINRQDPVHADLHSQPPDGMAAFVSEIALETVEFAGESSTLLLAEFPGEMVQLAPPAIQNPPAKTLPFATMSVIVVGFAAMATVWWSMPPATKEVPIDVPVPTPAAELVPFTREAPIEVTAPESIRTVEPLEIPRPAAEPDAAPNARMTVSRPLATSGGPPPALSRPTVGINVRTLQDTLASAVEPPAAPPSATPDAASNRPYQNDPVVSARVERLPVTPTASASATPVTVRAVQPRPEAVATIASRTEQSRIEQTLGEYRDAYTMLDAQAARTVWPSVDVRALARAFDTLASQQVAFETCLFDIVGDSATAQCTGSATYTPKIGNREPKLEPRQWTFQLRKAGDDWKILNAQTSRWE